MFRDIPAGYPGRHLPGAAMRGYFKRVRIFSALNATLLAISGAFSEPRGRPVVATARFDFRIPAMWRRNKVTFFLFVRLLRDHPEDTDGITSLGAELGDTVLIRARARKRRGAFLSNLTCCNNP